MVRDDIVAEGGDVYMEREAEPGDLGATLAFGLTLTVPVVQRCQFSAKASAKASAFHRTIQSRLSSVSHHLQPST